MFCIWKGSAKFGIIVDYKKWKSTSHKRNIHHISRSGILWSENAKKNDEIYDKYFEKVLHEFN